MGITDREYDSLMSWMGKIDKKLDNALGEIKSLDKRLMHLEMIIKVGSWLFFSGGALGIVKLIISIFEFVNK